MTATGQSDGSVIIGDGSAGRELYSYIYDHFGVAAFTEDETSDYSLITDLQGWEWVRGFMQRLLSMDDLEGALRTSDARDQERLSRECGCGRDEEDALPPVLSPPRICWTWLQAAYERLGDREGLCRLHAYRILTSEVGPETTTFEQAKRVGAHHIVKLRKFAGDDWHSTVELIVDLQQRYHGDPMFHGRNPAYEVLLRQESLTDAAWEYCKARCSDLHDDEVIVDLFDVMARGHAEEACELLLEPLHDADSKVLHNDTEENVEHIRAMLRLVATFVGPSRMRVEAVRLRSMYRYRRSLRDALKRLLSEYDDGGTAGVSVAD